MKEFIIDKISRETLEEYGYDSSNVDDDTMKKIAEALRHSFRNCVLPCISEVCDSFDIPESKQPTYSVSRIYIYHKTMKTVIYRILNYSRGKKKQ